MASTYPIPPAMAALFVRRVVVPARPSAEAPVRAADPPAAIPAPAAATAPPPRRNLRRGTLLDIFV